VNVEFNKVDIDPVNGNYFSQLDLVVSAVCYTGRMSNEQFGHYEYFKSENRVTLYPAN